VIGGRLVPNTEFGHLEIDGADAETRAADSAREREELSWEDWGKRLTTYGLKERLDEVLAALGQKTLAKAWQKGGVNFPTATIACEPGDWPMAFALDATAVAKAAKEASTLPKRAEIEARAEKTMKGDEDFAGDTTDVVVALAQIVTKAAKAKSALMVLVDGEQ